MALPSRHLQTLVALALERAAFSRPGPDGRMQPSTLADVQSILEQLQGRGPGRGAALGYAYDPNEPRDETGEWTEGGGSPGSPEGEGLGLFDEIEEEGEPGQFASDHAAWEKETQRLEQAHAEAHGAWEEAHGEWEEKTNALRAQFKADHAAFEERYQQRKILQKAIVAERARPWTEVEQAAEGAKAPHPDSGKNQRANTEERKTYLEEARAFVASQPGALAGAFGSKGMLGQKLRALGAADEDFAKLDAIQDKAKPALAKSGKRWLAAVEKCNQALEKWDEADRAEREILDAEPDASDTAEWQDWQARAEAAGEKSAAAEARSDELQERADKLSDKNGEVWDAFQAKAEAFGDDLITELSERVEQAEEDDEEPDLDDAEQYPWPDEPDEPLEPDYPDEPEEPEEEESEEEDGEDEVDQHARRAALIPYAAQEPPPHPLQAGLMALAEGAFALLTRPPPAPPVVHVAPAAAPVVHVAPAAVEVNVPAPVESPLAYQRDADLQAVLAGLAEAVSRLAEAQGREHPAPVIHVAPAAVEVKVEVPPPRRRKVRVLRDEDGNVTGSVEE